MKKIVSLLLVTLMILSAFTLCFSSSAEAANKDPKFAAADSMTVAVPGETDKTRLGTKYLFYALAGGMAANSGLIDKDYASALNADKSKSFNTSVKSTANTIDIKCVAKPDGYASVISFQLAEGTKKSIVITAPSSGHANGGKLPKALDFYACDDYWHECKKDKYNVTIASDAVSDRVYTLVYSIKDLDSKWKVSADGSFRYIEADLDKEFTNNFLTVAFYCDAARTENSPVCYLNEIAVFSSSIAEPAPVNPGTNSSATDPGTNSSATNPTTGDNFTLMTVLSLGAVLTAAAVVVKVRKKED